MKPPGKDHFRSAGVDEPLFFALMECLGIAAWRGSGRTGGEDDFRTIRKLHLNKEKKFKQFPAANLKSVALNIHTRAGEVDASSGFEFIHKSFGEYLAARGLLSHALNTAKVLEDYEPEDIEQHWCQLIGSAELTREIIDFLYDEARRTLQPDPALEAKEALTELINWVVANGFSVHNVSPELPWADLVQRQRCATSALIASISAVATTIPIGSWDDNVNTDWTVNVKWPAADKKSVANLFEEIGTTDERPICRALRRVNISNASLWDKGLTRANLEGADLRGATMTWGLMIGTNLENANLSNVFAPETRLRGANLRGAILKSASLESAIFHAVDMSFSDLSDADLENVDASFSRTYAPLNDFSDRLVRAAVDLNGAILTDAKLSNADLSGAINLTLDAVNSAKGNKKTILPDYIDRSKVRWLKEKQTN